uniref:Uncharacterized protein n=1 Tax=Caenorhabditis japonica TaxID=281687 RepID=A0A8R1IW55_CAEJA
MSSSSYSTITNNEGQKYNGPMYDDTAMVLKRFPTFFVVYLRERNMAAWLPRQICRSSVTLGKCITVEYIPFEHHPGKDFIHWEVTRVVNVIQGRSEVREDGDDALPLFHVDLYDIGTEWNDYREFGGQPIVKSDDCIYATVADRVKTAQGETISANELIRRYQSKKQAKRLCGFMAYKVDVVPQRMLDQEYHGEDEVEAYTFQLIELVGSHEHYTRKQNNLDSTNLGYENRNLQEDDEIARAKLAIREEQERRMNRSSPTGSFATGQSNYDERSRYASGRTSSASYYTSAPNQDPFNTGAPREFNDRGSTSSYQSASAYPQAHPQPQPQHQYRGKTSPPLSHDTEKERMRQMVSDMSFILKSLESVARQTRVLNPEEEHLFAQGSRISKEFVDRGFHKKP